MDFDREEERIHTQRQRITHHARCRLFTWFGLIKCTFCPFIVQQQPWEWRQGHWFLNVHWLATMCVNNPFHASSHMGCLAKMGLTGSSDGQRGMWEFCNLCLPAGHLASKREVLGLLFPSWENQMQSFLLFRQTISFIFDMFQIVFGFQESVKSILNPPWVNSYCKKTLHMPMLYRMVELVQLGDWLYVSVVHTDSRMCCSVFTGKQKCTTFTIKVSQKATFCSLIFNMSPSR